MLRDLKSVKIKDSLNFLIHADRWIMAEKTAKKTSKKEAKKNTLIIVNEKQHRGCNQGRNQQ